MRFLIYRVLYFDLHLTLCVKVSYKGVDWV